ncbi:hypothetical protein HDU67_007313 [Dinochytrium kinnereticum]|nr:hypothetical protein HDU67_007313 [Dinochytrium kinnereticum]
MADRRQASRAGEGEGRRGLRSLKLFFQLPDGFAMLSRLSRLLGPQRHLDRTLFSFGSGGGRPSDVSQANGGDAVSPSRDSERRLVDELRAQFVEKLEKTGSADESWREYSQLMESMLEKVNLSVVSHHRLFGDISATPVPSSLSTSKANVLTKIIGKLGKSATRTEFARLALLYEKQNDIVKMRSLLNQMKASGIAPSISILNALIRTNIRTGNFTTAMAVFQGLRGNRQRRLSQSSEEYLASTSGRSLEFEEPNGATYSAIMGALYRSGDYALVETLYKEMIDSNVPLTLGSIHLVMLISMRKGQFARALEQFDLIKTNGLRPSVYSYRLMIQSLLNSGKLEDAVDVLYEMEASINDTVPKPDTSIYNLILQTIVTQWKPNTPASQGLYRLAFSLFDRMKERKSRVLGMQPSAEVLADVSTYELVAQLACKVQSIASLIKAHDLVMEMVRLRYITHPRLWSALVVSFCSAKEVPAALKIAEDSASHLAEGACLSYNSLQALAQGLLHRNDVENALTVLQRALTAQYKLEIDNVVVPLFRRVLDTRSFDMLERCIAAVCTGLEPHHLLRVWVMILSSTSDHYFQTFKSSKDPSALSCGWDHCSIISSRMLTILSTSSISPSIAGVPFTDSLLLSISKLSSNPIYDLASIFRSDFQHQPSLLNSISQRFSFPPPSTTAMVAMSRALLDRGYNVESFSLLVQAASEHPERRLHVVMMTLRHALFDGGPTGRTVELEAEDKNAINAFLIENGIWSAL